jgi:hypothetical protein
LGVSSPEDDTHSKVEETAPLPKVIESTFGAKGVGADGAGGDAKPPFNPEIEPPTVLFPSVSSSSPSGPVRTAPTQMAMTPKEEIAAPTVQRSRSRSRSWALMGMSGALVVGLGGWLVVKMFGTRVDERAELAGQANVAVSTVESVVPLPVVASVDVATRTVEPASSSLSEAKPVASVTPALSASVASPIVEAKQPSVPARKTIKAVNTSSTTGKPSGPRDLFPDD